MNQLTLETFFDPEIELKDEQAKQALVSILEDFNVAWTDRNSYLHSQDLVYLDENLAAILVSRGIARKVFPKSTHLGLV